MGMARWAFIELHSKQTLQASFYLLTALLTHGGVPVVLFVMRMVPTTVYQLTARGLRSP